MKRQFSPSMRRLKTPMSKMFRYAPAKQRQTMAESGRLVTRVVKYHEREAAEARQHQSVRMQSLLAMMWCADDTEPTEKEEREKLEGGENHDDGVMKL